MCLISRHKLRYFRGSRFSQVCIIIYQKLSRKKMEDEPRSWLVSTTNSNTESTSRCKGSLWNSPRLKLRGKVNLFSYSIKLSRLIAKPPHQRSRKYLLDASSCQTWTQDDPCSVIQHLVNIKYYCIIELGWWFNNVRVWWVNRMGNWLTLNLGLSVKKKERKAKRKRDVKALKRGLQVDTPMTKRVQ